MAIAHYNRGATAHRPLCNLLNHSLIGEIVFFDDGSSLQEFEALEDTVRSLGGGSRIRIERRDQNRGAQQTKLDAVAACQSDWVLVLDSDNTAFSGYLRELGRLTDRRPNTIYCSPHAYPYFSFKPLAGRVLDFETCCNLTRDGLLRRCFIINDGNYLVHRETYLRQLAPLRDLKSDVADVMVANYLWLSQGGMLEVLKSGAYHHRIDASSFWMRTADESRDRVIKIFALLQKNLRWQEGGNREILSSA